MNLSYHPLAGAEIAQAAVWYAEQGGELLASEFNAELEAVVRLLLRHPTLGTPGRRGSRQLRLLRFPYTVVYRVEGDFIRMLAVAHQRRRPGYWRGRL